MPTTVSRRTFLQSTASAGAVLAIGLDPRGALASTAQAGGNLTPFVKIFEDGTVAAIIKHFEGGQGVTTGLSALIAEEMNMRLQDITFEMAPSDDALYANLFLGAQVTGGSTAIANSFMQYRTAAAATREMLIAAAADAWGVDRSRLSLRDGVISGSGKSAGIGSFVEAAAMRDVPAEPRLKDRSEWTVIGVDQKARLDTPAKVDGSARYSMDMQLDSQIVVAIRRSPRLGGVVASFDDSAARSLPGFIMAIRMPDNKGVMAYAETTWAAFQARDALEITWDHSSAESRSSDALKSELLDMVRAEPKFQASETDLQTSTAAINGAARVVEREFYFPLLAHATMEAMGATIEPLPDGGIILHDGAQAPSFGRAVMGGILGLEQDKIRINTLYAGGFFGRRTTPDSDYLRELAFAFAATDRSRPVKLQWSREDDITGGYYRPAYAHRARVGLDEDGNITGWDHRIAGHSIIKGTALESFAVKDGVDNSSVEGVRHNPYVLPAFHIGLTDQKGPTTSNWWRSVGHTHTGYAMECMMDVCARAAGIDPVEYRLRYLSGSGTDQRRMAGVIRLASEKANWGGTLPDGHYHGFAAHKSFNSYVAEVCEISTDSDGVVTIEKVTAAVDCGIAVTPDVVRAQIEGGIGYGIGHAMRAEITLTDGVVDQSNFHDYEALRVHDLRNIETHIVSSEESPTGVGEPGTPPAAPALANAIVAAGHSLPSHLPMTNSGIRFS